MIPTLSPDVHVDILRFLDIWDAVVLLRTSAPLYFDRIFWQVVALQRTRTNVLMCPSNASLSTVDFSTLRQIVLRSASLHQNLSLPRPVCRSFRYMDMNEHLIDLIPASNALLTYQTLPSPFVTCWNLTTGREVAKISCPRVTQFRTSFTPSPSDNGLYIFAFVSSSFSGTKWEDILVVIRLNYSDEQNIRFEGMHILPILPVKDSAAAGSMTYSVHACLSWVTIIGRAYGGEGHCASCARINLASLSSLPNVELMTWFCRIPLEKYSVVNNTDYYLQEKKLCFIFELLSIQDRNYRQIIYYAIDFSNLPNEMDDLAPCRLWEVNPSLGVNLHVFPDSSRGLCAVVEDVRSSVLIRSFGMAFADANARFAITLVSTDENQSPRIYIKRLMSREGYQMLVVPYSQTPSLQLHSFHPDLGSYTVHELQIPPEVASQIDWHMSKQSIPLSGYYEMDFRMGTVVIRLGGGKRTVVLSYA